MVLLFYVGENFKWFEFINDTAFYSWLFLMGLLHYGDYFIKFVNSIKSFDDGIQLPRRKSEIIPWKEVYAFTKIDNKVTFSSSKGEHEFDIDPEDYRYTLAIIADWKLKNER